MVLHKGKLIVELSSCHNWDEIKYLLNAFKKKNIVEALDTRNVNLKTSSILSHVEY